MNKQNGITLIALVITIIVLLILAGVAISTLLGNDSIINNADEAVGKYNDKAEAEEAVLNTLEKKLIEFSNGGGTSIETPDEPDIHPEEELAQAPEKYRHENQPAEILDVGITEDGESVNLGLWGYSLIDNSEDSKCTSYNGTIENGAIIGKMPAYVYYKSTGQVSPITTLYGTFECQYSLSIDPGIPSTVTSIDYCAFGNCKILTEVAIPNSVTIIEDEAFSFCNALTDISIPGSVAEIRGRGVLGL